VMAILHGLNLDRGITLILVTHDPALSEHTNRVLHLYDGLILREENVPEPLLGISGGDDA
ncbi:MAG: hypothetical protein MUQ10_13625, partial [Anaerolineae bacterium]|nr:hypothetical protein [Anaerolineae bacterium]